MNKYQIEDEMLARGKRGPDAPIPSGIDKKQIENMILTKNFASYPEKKPEPLGKNWEMPQTADQFVERGVFHTIKGDHDKAIEDYTNAIKRNQKHIAAYTNRGVAYKNKGDLEKAMEDQNRALQLDPFCVKAYTNRGNVYWEMDEDEKALADFTYALSLNPEHASAYLNRGLLYFCDDRFAEAIADFENMLRLDPSNKTAQEYLQEAKKMSNEQGEN